MIVETLLEATFTYFSNVNQKSTFAHISDTDIYKRNLSVIDIHRLLWNGSPFAYTHVIDLRPTLIIAPTYVLPSGTDVCTLLWHQRKHGIYKPIRHLYPTLKAKKLPVLVRSLSAIQPFSHPLTFNFPCMIDLRPPL